LRESLGVVEAPEPESYDQRFYWGVGNPKQLNDREEVDQDGNPMWVQVLGTVDGEPAMVDDKVLHVTKGLSLNGLARSRTRLASCWLRPIGWYCVKPSDRWLYRQKLPPRDWQLWLSATDWERQITGCATVEELIAVVGAQNWPGEPDGAAHSRNH